jgi:hypothetical protein
MTLPHHVATGNFRYLLSPRILHLNCFVEQRNELQETIRGRETPLIGASEKP